MVCLCLWWEWVKFLKSYQGFTFPRILGTPQSWSGFEHAVECEHNFKRRKILDKGELDLDCR